MGWRRPSRSRPCTSCEPPGAQGSREEWIKWNGFLRRLGLARADNLQDDRTRNADLVLDEIDKRIDQVPQSTLDAFAEYDWPGNVRELQNLVERAVIRSDDGVLPNPLLPAETPRGSVLSQATEFLPIEESGNGEDRRGMLERAATDSLEDIQRQHILRVLDRTGWLISGPNGAGAILNIHPNTLRSLMDRLASFNA